MENAEAHYFCPITNEIMQEPVIAADGYTYEKEAIQTWLVRRQTSPVTNLPLTNKDLIPNHTLKSWIIAHQESLRKAQKCFLPYEELENKLQEALKVKSNLEEIKKEWNCRKDVEKLKWLEELGLNEESYLYIKVEFKQFLSETTQGQRHAMKERSGKHPSTEDFWKMATEMHMKWVEQMNQKKD